MPHWASSTVSIVRFVTSCAILQLTTLFFTPATEEFDELCFQFGIELDDDVSKEGGASFGHFAYDSCCVDYRRSQEDGRKAGENGTSCSLMSMSNVSFTPSPVLLALLLLSQALKIDIPANR